MLKKFSKMNDWKVTKESNNEIWALVCNYESKNNERTRHSAQSMCSWNTQAENRKEGRIEELKALWAWGNVMCKAQALLCTNHTSVYLINWYCVEYLNKEWHNQSKL